LERLPFWELCGSVIELYLADQANLPTHHRQPISGGERRAVNAQLRNRPASEHQNKPSKIVGPSGCPARTCLTIGINMNAEPEEVLTT
jgi:hypothetical protein